MAVITLDFETFFRTGYSLSSLSYEEYIFHPEFYVHSVGVKINDETTRYYADNEVRPALRELFFPGNPHTLICHNLMFDGAILSWYYGLAAKTYWCTQCMSRGLWPQERTSLEQLAIRLWPDNLSMRKGKELENFRGVKQLTPEQHITMGDYCIQDVDLTFAAARVLVPRIPDTELEAIHFTLSRFLHPVVRVDHARLVKFLDEHRTEQERIILAAGISPDYETSRAILASNLKFAAWLEKTHGLVIPKVLSPTAKNPDNEKLPLSKADKEFIELQLDHPELKHVWIARMMATSNIAETRAMRLIGHSSVFPNHQLAIPKQYYGAHTGRWSGCNKINMENLQAGSQHRLALIAPPGYRIGVVDLANIEGRVMAWFAQQLDVCQAFADNVDLYDRMATAVYGYEVRRNHEVIDHETGKKIKPHAKEGFVGKTMILGLGYGMGAKKLRHTFLVGGRGGEHMFFSLAECEHFVRVYRNANDRFAACWAYAQKMLYHMTSKGEDPIVWRCLKVGYRWIKLPNNMYLSYPKLERVEDDRGNIQYQYWNGKHMTSIHGAKLIENIIQALSRIILNDARRAVTEHLAQYNDPNQCVLMTVHDEIVAILSEETVETDMDFIHAAMKQTPTWAADGLLVLNTAGGHDVCYSK